MSLFTLHRFASGSRSTRRSARRGQRLRLEPLEERTLLSAYLVTTTADSGLGSLRDAINQINADTSHTLYASPSNPAVDEIDFQITATSDTGGGYNATTGVATIAPLSNLPATTNAVLINGYTQPGASPNTLLGPAGLGSTDPVLHPGNYGDNAVLKIELNGANNAQGTGLIPKASNITVQGLVVNRFTNFGIDVRGSNDTIQGNFIGTDVTGTVALGNGSPADGVPVDSFATGGVNFTEPNETIGGSTPAARNLISGNMQVGVGPLYGTDTVNGTVIQGNFIGTDVTGRLALSNGVGIARGGVSMTIVGNLLSGNARRQINGASGTLIQGNYVGTDVTGSAPLGGSADAGIVAWGATIMGNVISSNYYGVQDSVGGDVIQGNFIGTDATGMHPLGNRGAGIYSFDGPNTIGGTTPGAGNVISGNSIGIFYGHGNLIQGNLIGTDATGKQALSNNTAIYLAGDMGGNTIGGTTAAARNVIKNGLFIFNSGNLIEGNYIGTDITGTSALGGIVELAASATNNTIGGTTAAARNLIVGRLGFHGSSGNVAEGNYIGTDVTGTLAFGTLAAGNGVVLTDGASNNTIGGTTPGAGNLIAYSTDTRWNAAGVALVSGSTGNLVQGNTIVHNAGPGVMIDSANNNTIGGTASGAANTIASNHGPGVWVYNATGDTILGNSIFGNVSNPTYANGGVGIQLDSATNANHNQAAPVLQLAVSAGGTTAIAGTLHSVASTTFTLQFFSNAAPSPSGYGEGKTLLGNYTVTTDVNGNAKFVAVLSAGVPVGEGSLSATATNQSSNDTSQFAQDLVNVVPNTAGLYIGVSPALVQRFQALLAALQRAGDLKLDASHLEALIAQLLGL